MSTDICNLSNLISNGRSNGVITLSESRISKLIGIIFHFKWIFNASERMGVRKWIEFYTTAYFYIFHILVIVWFHRMLFFIKFVTRIFIISVTVLKIFNFSDLINHKKNQIEYFCGILIPWLLTIALIGKYVWNKWKVFINLFKYVVHIWKARQKVYKSI